MGLQNNKYSNIKGIVDNNLCTSCGVCETICPVGAISFKWTHDSKKPIIDFNKCTGCGSCYAVCPGKNIQFQDECKSQIEKEFGKVDTSFLFKKNENVVGKYVASAGFITSFFKYLFDTKQIDGALVVSLKGHDMKDAKSSIIKGIDDLEQIGGSIYCQVPLSESLKELERLEGKFAVVGLPCQIRGINNLIKRREDFKKKIVIKIGLFCGYMVGYSGMNYLLESLKIPKTKKIEKISFRAKKSTEDGFLVETSDGDYFVSRGKYSALLNRSFSNRRCLMCNDMGAEFADIACGDAHGFSGKQSLVLSRNKESTSMIQDAINKGYLSLNRSLSIGEAYASQRLILKYKKGTIGARLRIMKWFNKVIPNYETGPLPRSNLFQKIGSFFYILNCYINDTKLGRKIFFSFPDKMTIFFSHILTYFLSGRPFDVFSDIYKKLKKGDKH
jgi:coenzyme F420 hydrogenase subunit beta